MALRNRSARPHAPPLCRNVRLCTRAGRIASRCKDAAELPDKVSILVAGKSFNPFQSERPRMKNLLLIAALVTAATASIAQTAAPASPASSGAQSAAPDANHQGPHGRHGRPDPKKMADRHVARLDTDKDGKVSRQEYLARQSEAFSKADANGDGFVTPDEMAARHEKHRAAMSARRDGGKTAAPAK
jgi:hypothetical protein